MYIGYIFAWGVALCSPLYAFLLGLVDITLPELSIRGYILSLWCILLIMFIEIVLFLCYTYHLDSIKYCKESRRYDTEWSTPQYMLPPRPTAAANTINTTQGMYSTSDGVLTTAPTTSSSTPNHTLSKEVIEERNETLRLVMDIQYPSPPPSLVQSRHGRYGRNGRGQTEYKHRFTPLSRSYQGFTPSSTTTATTDAAAADPNYQNRADHHHMNNNDNDDELYETKGDGDNLDMADDDNNSSCTSSSSDDDGGGGGESTIPSIPSYKDSNTSIGLIVCELRKVYPPHTELSFKGVLTVLFSYGTLILSQVREYIRVLVGRRQNANGHNYDSIDNINPTLTDINPTGVHPSELSSLDNKSATVVAVENICFNVKKGEIFGLLGSNGAG